MDQAIETRGLTKSFGRTVALDGLDLVVERGQVHGFLGPNGAGKSTTIRLLLGLLRADGGKATVLGADPWRDAVTLHRRLAYVPGDVALWPTLSGGEAIDLLCALRGSVDRARRDELVDRFALDPTKRCSSYSKGNRQKVAIVAGLAADVELFLLDEPTSGLDPLMEAVFRDVVREITAAGGTVLLSSHILAEAEALCDAVSIIRAGRIVETGSLAALRHLTRTTLHVTTRVPLDRPEAWPGVFGAEVSDRTARLEVGADDLGGVIERIAAHGVVTLTSAPPTLEELFLRHYGDALARLDGEREPAVTR
ncbi:MAG: ABC transporter ATP-binding protein [Cellulomonas sp. 73-92]|uniref:ABC transporter ATP-binding protein n=1 Tax=Cellulomonas sp. 73-92 TaxID=1895740 RepID=UPI000925CCCE|nr:ABC transporter ATP-binding protein [Cellulomonas sp. 73-92]OJV78559.1 MAG: ABC transporter ATP-binding protein [Cellulomonas sp. 73-92]